MSLEEKIETIEQKINDLAEKTRLISERQNSNYTDIMLRLKELNDAIIERNEEPEDHRSVNDLYDEAVEDLDILEMGKVSKSYLQRTLQIGYYRASALMELMEQKGVIGPDKGSGGRAVIKKNQNVITEKD